MIACSSWRRGHPTTILTFLSVFLPTGPTLKLVSRWTIIRHHGKRKWILFVAEKLPQLRDKLVIRYLLGQWLQFLRRSGGTRPCSFTPVTGRAPLREARVYLRFIRKDKQVSVIATPPVHASLRQKLAHAETSIKTKWSIVNSWIERDKCIPLRTDHYNLSSSCA